MLATTISYPSLNIVFRPLPVAEPEPALDSLLQLTVAQANSEGAYLYRFDRSQGSLQLSAWHGRRASEIGAFDVQLRSEAARWHRENLGAVLWDQAAWSDWRLERFPEFLRNRFEAAASVPLLDGGEILGLLHVCRLAPLAYQAGEAAFLGGVGLRLANLLAHLGSPQ